MNPKKIIIILGITILIIGITIFFFFFYKIGKNGNTMINKSEEEIVETILTMKSYRATLNITVETNKNKTQYTVKQNLENGKAKQEVIEPENIAGVITEYDGEKITIKNNKLNLETTFQNYQYIVENGLWLDSFIETYQKNGSTIRNETEIILETKKEDNPYQTYQALYIDKKTGKPTKMIVKDINQKTLVYILYTEITISK